MASSAKKRCYTFTLNNYTEEDIEKILACGAKYVFQEEKGEEKGTEHLQGILSFENAVSFNTVKKLLPRAHWEVCKNKRASIIYCSKENTRNGRMWHTLPIPKKTGTLAQSKNKKKTFEEKLEEDRKNFHEEFRRAFDEEYEDNQLLRDIINGKLCLANH